MVRRRNRSSEDGFPETRHSLSLPRLALPSHLPTPYSSFDAITLLPLQTHDSKDSENPTEESEQPLPPPSALYVDVRRVRGQDALQSLRSRMLECSHVIVDLRGEFSTDVDWLLELFVPSSALRPISKTLSRLSSVSSSSFLTLQEYSLNWCDLCFVFDL